jgi:DNA replication protein DnaD
MTKPAKSPQTTAAEDKSWFKKGKEGKYLSLPFDAVLDRNLKFESLKVLMAIAKHADTDGRCFPSRGLLAELTGMHPVNVSKATRKLVELGWLTMERRNGRSSIFYLRVPGSPPITKQNPTDSRNAQPQGDRFDTESVTDFDTTLPDWMTPSGL